MLRSLVVHCPSPLKIALAVLLLAPGVQAQNPQPFLYPLVPAAIAPGGPAFNLTVRGVGFAPGAIVNWNGSPRATAFVSASQLTGEINAADIAAGTTAVITVTNPSPGGGSSNPEYFQVTVPTAGLVFRDTVPQGPAALKVAVGDFNGDRKPDLVQLAAVVNDQGNDSFSIQVLLGNGDGTFQAPITVLEIPPNYQISDLTVADVNGDGKQDVVGSAQDFNSAPYDTVTFVLLGNGDGTFQIAESDVDSSGYLRADQTVVADVNGDGMPDLVRACRRGVCVELGNGDGTFRKGFTYSPVTPNELPLPAEAVLVGDFRHTGKLDIVAAFDYSANGIGSGSYYLFFLPGNGDGTFGPASTIYEGPTFFQPSFQGTSGGLESLFAADFHNDGNLDLAFYFYDSTTSSGALSVMRGNGDGSFQGPLTAEGLPESYQRSTLIPGDFNGDGNLDLAVNNIVVLLGTRGGPDTYTVAPTSSPYIASGAADFNGDGRLDLVGIDSNMNMHVLLQATDFSASINPPYQTVEPGDVATYTVSVNSINGFAGIVHLTASGLPPAATASFSPGDMLVGSGTVTLTITTLKHTVKGRFSIAVSATSGTLTHSVGTYLNVGPLTADFSDFTLSMNPGSQTVVSGVSTNFQVSVSPIEGFTSDVQLVVTKLPPGATATFDPAVISGGSGSSVLTIDTRNPTPSNTYHPVVRGIGGSHQHDDVIALNVVTGTP